MGSMVNATFGLLYPRSGPNPLYRSLGGPRSQFGRVENWLLTGFDNRTVRSKESFSATLPWSTVNYNSYFCTDMGLNIGNSVGLHN